MPLLIELVPTILALIAVIQCSRAASLPHDRRRNNRLAFSIAVFSCVLVLVAQVSLISNMLFSDIALVTNYNSITLLLAVFKSAALMSFILFAESALPKKIKPE